MTLKILNNLRARNTLMPNDVPGWMMDHRTSNMLPHITWGGGGGRGRARVSTSQATLECTGVSMLVSELRDSRCSQSSWRRSWGRPACPGRTFLQTSPSGRSPRRQTQQNLQKRREKKTRLSKLGKSLAPFGTLTCLDAEIFNICRTVGRLPPRTHLENLKGVPVGRNAPLPHTACWGPPNTERSSRRPGI